MISKASTLQLKAEPLIFVGMVVDPQLAENDFRLSVAGNIFQLKLLRVLSPDLFINILPVFLGRQTFPKNFTKNEVVLDTNIQAPRLAMIVAKIIGDALKFLPHIVFKKSRTFVFYNIDYSNIFLALFARFLGHRTFVVAADYVYPPRTVFERLALWTYQKMSGVIALRENCTLNDNLLFLSAIIEDDASKFVAKTKDPVALFSGSLGETTGLQIVLEAAIASPGVKFYFTGRPFHISKQDLAQKVKSANAKGANIEYLGMLTFQEYCKILRKTTIALSMRNPNDPEHNNNFPSKIAEFMSAGKVVVSSLSYSELPQNSYVKVDFTKQSLAAALARIVEDPASSIKIGEDAREFSHKRFSIQNAKLRIREFLML